MLVGGGGRIPGIASALESTFDAATIAVPEPEAATAKGAALLAGVPERQKFPLVTGSGGRVSGALVAAVVVGGLMLGYGVKEMVPQSEENFSPTGSQVIETPTTGPYEPPPPPEETWLPTKNPYPTTTSVPVPQPPVPTYDYSTPEPSTSYPTFDETPPTTSDVSPEPTTTAPTTPPTTTTTTPPPATTTNPDDLPWIPPKWPELPTWLPEIPSIAPPGHADPVAVRAAGGVRSGRDTRADSGIGSHDGVRRDGCTVDRGTGAGSTDRGRPPGQSRIWLTDTGSPGFVAEVSADGCAPPAMRCAPSAAIITPLSVHNRGRGTRSVRPAAAQRSSASARIREFAVAPPPRTRVSTPTSCAARTAFIVSTSATDSWKPAATSATGTSSPARCFASTNRATAVLRPENEKS